MQAERLITQSYVLREDGNEYVIAYYLCCEEALDGMTCYGLRIEALTSGGTSSQKALFEESEEAAIEIIHQFARNFVFPDSLQDLVYDYRKYKSFV